MVTTPGHTRVPHHIDRDPALNGTRRSVLINIVGHAGTTGYAIKQDTIATECGYSLRTVSRTVRWLVANRYLVIEKRSSNKGRKANRYLPGPAWLEPLGKDGVLRNETPLQHATGGVAGRRTTTSEDLSREIPTRGTKEKDLSLESSTSAREVKSTRTHLRPETVPGICSGSGAESVGSPHPKEQPHATFVRRSECRRMTAFETVVDRLDRVQRTGTNTLASCPVASHGRGNGDRNPSLSVTEKDGRVLLHCMSGCLVDEILATLGLDFPDLWDEPLEREQKVSEYVYLSRTGDPYFIAERWQSGKGKRFVQRLPGEEKPGLDGLQTTLYQLPRVLAAAAAHQPIWVVEGEKCVHAIETLGVVATTSPGGAAHWQDLFTDRLVGASCVNIVADNDDAGKKHAAMVMASCKQKGIPTRVWRAAVDGEKADVYDHVIAGKGIADLIPLRLNPTKPEGVDPRRLRRTEYPPITWVIPGLLPTGTAVLAGEPKSGKSLMTLDWGIGVASGRDTMHQVDTTQGSVLYLSLDNDSERRLQRRFNVMTTGLSNTDDLPIEFHTTWPIASEAIAAVVEWAEIEEQGDRVPRLVIADTLTMIEPGWESGPGGQTGYTHTVKVMHRWNQLAQDLDLAIVFVHHTRKSQQNGSANWKERILGSQGLSATINTILMLDNAKTEDNVLHVAGRDVGAQDLEIRRDGLLWNCVDRPHVDRPRFTIVPGQP